MQDDSDDFILSGLATGLSVAFLALLVLLNGWGAVAGLAGVAFVAWLFKR